MDTHKVDILNTYAKYVLTVWVATLSATNWLLATIKWSLGTHTHTR